MEHGNKLAKDACHRHSWPVGANLTTQLSSNRVEQLARFLIKFLEEKRPSMTVVLYSDLRDMLGEMQPHLVATVIFAKISRLLLHVGMQINKTQRYYLFRGLPLSLISRLSRELKKSRDEYYLDHLRSRSITNCQYMMNELMNHKLVLEFPAQSR